MTRLSVSSRMPVAVSALAAFHLNAANLTAVSPRFPPFRVVSAVAPSRPGDLQRFRVGAGTLSFGWVARVMRVVPDSLLEDTQESGPFIRWRHQHRFAPDGRGGSILTDGVSFRLAPTVAGEFLEFLFVRPALLGLFALRHRNIRMRLSRNTT